MYTGKIRKFGKVSEDEEEIAATSTEENSFKDLRSNKGKKRKVKKIIDSDSDESSQTIDIVPMANLEVAIKIKNEGVMVQLNNNIANHLLLVEPFKITYKNIFKMSFTTIKTSLDHYIKTADLNTVIYLKNDSEKIVNIPLLKNIKLNVLEDHPLKDIVIHLNNIANCIDSTNDEFMKQQLYFNILDDSIIEYYKKISILLQEDWNRANNRLKTNGIVSFVDKELEISALNNLFIKIIKNNFDQISLKSKENENKIESPKSSFSEKKKESPESIFSENKLEKKMNCQNPISLKNKFLIPKL